MATNVYFQSGNTSGTANEQRLVEDLVIESLKIYGHDVHYNGTLDSNKIMSGKCLHVESPDDTFVLGLG